MIALKWTMAFSFGCVLAWAQDLSPTDGFTPAAIAAGTPQGVAMLSPHEAVNLFNGNLSFSIPLYTVGGRGQAGYNMVLPIGAKWNMESDITGPLDNPHISYVPIASVYPYDMLWPASQSVNRYSPGRILRRDVVDQTSGTVRCGSYDYHYGDTLTRLTWIDADGTEHEFHDSLNSGAPLPSRQSAAASL